MNRFWDKVDKSGDCWEWIASKDEHGYGFFGFDGRVCKAHRVAFILEIDDIPDGMCVCHSCDNPSCVNPDHLFLGTHTDNMRDMLNKGRGNKAFGEKHTKAKLSEEEVLFIKENLHFMSGASLARAFNVHESTISGIKNGKTWKQLGV